MRVSSGATRCLILHRSCSLPELIQQCPEMSISTMPSLRCTVIPRLQSEYVLQASGLQRRSRHVELRVYFCQELIKQGRIRLHWIDAGGQIADALTKTLGAKLFHRFSVLMGYLKRSELSTEAYAHELILRSQIRASPTKSKSMKSQRAPNSDLLPSSHSGVSVSELKTRSNDNPVSSVPGVLPGSPSSLVSEPESVRSLLID